MLTSSECTHAQAQTLLTCMFGASKASSHDHLTRAFDDLNRWVGNGVVDVKCAPRSATRFVYLIRYSSPSA